MEEDQKTSQVANQLGNGPLMLTYNNPAANVMPMPINMGMPMVNNAFPLNPQMNMMGNNLQNPFPNMGGNYFP